MNYHLFISCLFLSLLGMAQSNNLDNKCVLKIYNLSTYQKTTSNSTDSIFKHSTYSKDLQILHPTIAYSWSTKNQNLNEIELTTLIFKRNSSNSTVQNTTNNLPVEVISGADVLSSTVSLRYEFIINFLKNAALKFVPTLGWAINPYYNQVKQKPHTTQTFPSSFVNIGAAGFIIPRLCYNYSTKCFFDFNIPINIFDAKTIISTVRDPGIPVGNQRNSESLFKLFPLQFSLRLGVGIKI